MISQVVDPPERLREEAQTLAEKIARNSPAAMAATKRALWGAARAGPHRRLQGGRHGAGLHVGSSRPESRAPWPSPRSGSPGGPRSRGPGRVDPGLRRGRVRPRDHARRPSYGDELPCSRASNATYRGTLRDARGGTVAGHVRPLGSPPPTNVSTGSAPRLTEATAVFWLPGTRPRTPTQRRGRLSRRAAGWPRPPSRPPGEWSYASALDPGRAGRGLAPCRPAASDGTWLEPADETVDGGARRHGPGLLLAGPGVVRHRAVPGLHDLAVSAGVGVLNTWGAKGVFDWRSRHHLATVGLQADDFLLSGLHRAEFLDHRHRPRSP